MKKIIVAFSILMIILLCGISVFAAKVDDSGMWEYQTYGTGVVLTNYKGTQTDVYVPKNIIVDGEKIPVFKIGAHIFENNQTINSATLGEGIKIIGESAFSGATNLVCIVSSESLTTIEANAFKDCASFNSIIIYDTVSAIDDTAFGGCNNLVIYCNENSEGHKYAVSNKIKYIILNPDVTPETVILDGITYYIANGETTVMSCDQSKSGAVVLPLTVNNCPITKIRASAFADCTLITSVKIPETVRFIGSTAFIRCSNLSSVNIPEAVTAIYNNTFERTALRSIYLHEDIELVGGGAFLDCQSLTTVALPKKIKDLGAQIFWGCSSLQTIDIPDGVKILGYQLFAYCYKINNIKIPASVTTFESSSFDSCLKLTDIYYAGSRAQWLQIDDRTGGYNLSNKYFKDATIHYAIPTPVTSITLNTTQVDLLVGNTTTITPTVLPEAADDTSVTWISSNSSVARVDSNGVVTAVSRGTVTITAKTSNKDVFAECIINVDYPHGTFEGFTWEIDADGELKIFGEGQMPDFRTSNYAPWYNYRSQVKKSSIEERITSVGDYAFYYCSNMTSIVIPESVISIGKNAFQACTSLNEITLPKNLETIATYAFASCNKIPEISIPDTVTEIGTYAFYNCRTLKSVTLPCNIEIINNYAFYSCIYLETIVIPKSVKTLGSYAFAECTALFEIVLNEGIETINTYAFSGCTALAEITLPDTITTIDAYAFNNCTSISTIYIPEKLVTLQNNAFFNVPFTHIQIHENNQAFSQVDGVLFNKDKTTLILYPKASPVSEYTVPGTVTAIDSYAFYECVNLITINLPQSLISIGEKSFANCSSLTKIALPETLQTLSYGSFYSCIQLTQISIPGSVKIIPQQCFESCEKLAEVIISEGVEMIDFYAFKGCWSIKTVHIPDSISRTIHNAFYNCKRLTTIYYGGTQTHWELICMDSVLTSAKVTVHFAENVAVSGVTISQTALELPMYDTYYLSCTLTPLYPSNNAVIWDSDNPEVVSVQQNGAISTHKPGAAIITVTTEDGGYSAQCKVNVTNDYAVYKEGTAGSANWKLCKDGTFIISGYGKIKNYEIGTLSRPYWYEYYNSIKKVIINPGITNINISAFSSCKNLVSVEIPNTVQSIERSAFSGCSALEEIKIPKNVTQIDANAFSSCTSLKRVYIEDFETWCKIDFGYGSSYYESNYQYANPLNCGADLYVNNELVTEVVIPKTVEQIKKNVFYGWKNLKKVTLHNNITSIGKYAFGNCSGIETIYLPDSITEISSYAFNNCTGLKKLDLPVNLTKISNASFLGCAGIEYVKIPNGVTTIENSAFRNCTGIKKLIIPESVTSIGENAFAGCSAIAKTVIPENVSEIYKSSFFTNTVWIVYKGSYAHSFAETNNLLYVAINKTQNPEISYGMEISGYVKDIDGVLINGARVELLYEDGSVKKSYTTGALGKYKFDYAEVGKYIIHATDNDGNTASEIISVKRMNVFDVYLAGETDLILKKGYNVSGTVTPATAKVTISDTNGNIIKSVDTTDGTFTFADISRGSYIVKAENETGSATTEIYVSNENVTGITLEIKAQSASITGDTKIENRDGTYSSKIWVNVDLIDANGNVFANTKTDSDGKYIFKNVPAGSYNIVATTTEMRPAYGANFDKNFELKGYGYIEITEAGEYVVDTIILREEEVKLTTVSGKVTANGTTQDCEVILTNENGDQIAVFVTDNNGNYNFINIPDGMYCITAITKNDGMGFAVITIKNSIVHGDTDIKVAKADKISKREPTLLSIPDCNTKEEALLYKEAVLAEKTFYDSLSDKERKQLSEEWLEKLFKLIGLISDSSIQASEGVTVENVESVISSEEIDETIEFALSVTEVTAADAGEDGITTAEEYENEKIKDKKGKNKEIAKYYDITFSKDGQNIYNIQKQTETNGKLLITMEIPKEYKGHKHYSFIHMHKGEAITLVDLDDNPDTVTFEIDKFSTFALAYSDIELVGEVEETIYPANITYNAETGKISVSSTETGTLYIATYNGDSLSSVVSYDVVANASTNDYYFNSNQAAYVWNENLKPLCEKFVIGN